MNRSTSESMQLLRYKIQTSLFQYVREHAENASIQCASARFANLLLLLTSVAKLAGLYYENAQLARMFGREVLDPFLVEILLDSTSSNVGNVNEVNGLTDSTGFSTDLSLLTKQKSFDVATQTMQKLEIAIDSPCDSFLNDSGISSANSGIGNNNNLHNNIIDIGLELAAQATADLSGHHENDSVYELKRRRRSGQTSGSSGISAGSLNRCNTNLNSNSNNTITLDLFLSELPAEKQISPMTNPNKKNIASLISTNCFSSNGSRNCSPLSSTTSIQQQIINNCNNNMDITSETNAKDLNNLITTPTVSAANSEYNFYFNYETQTMQIHNNNNNDYNNLLLHQQYINNSNQLQECDAVQQLVHTNIYGQQQSPTTNYTPQRNFFPKCSNENVLSQKTQITNNLLLKQQNNNRQQENISLVQSQLSNNQYSESFIKFA